MPLWYPAWGVAVSVDATSGCVSFRNESFRFKVRFGRAISLNVIGIIKEIADDRAASLREGVHVRKEASETCSCRLCNNAP